jgi:hypothetical protein
MRNDQNLRGLEHSQCCNIVTLREQPTPIGSLTALVQARPSLYHIPCFVLLAHIYIMKMESIDSSETLVTTNENTRRHIPVDSNHQII